MIHMLTLNNQKTIRKTLESLKPLGDKVLVGDLGSSDQTKQICDEYGVEVVRCVDNDRDVARNKLIEMTGKEMCLHIEPWEIVAQGFDSLKGVAPSIYNVMILQNGIITKETRVWFNDGKVKYMNPAFERINGITHVELPIVLYSMGRQDMDDMVERIEKWKQAYPLNSQPYYYQACALLIKKQYDEFLKVSEYYMHIEKANTMQAIMNRYYYAMVHLTYKRQLRAVLQNMSICLSIKPMMAEFWCLMADAYYHLAKDYVTAKEFYENAVIMGRFRKRTDNWPMEVAKYSKYPNTMVKSCNELIEGSYFLGQKSSSK